MTTLALAIAARDIIGTGGGLRVAGGRFNSREPYEAEEAQLGVADRGEFLGTVADAPAPYRGADVFALPADYETWGLVCMEALACGVPVVMSRVGCAEEVIVAGETGQIVGYDAQEIAGAIGALTTDTTTLATVRRHARTMAERYAWSTISRDYERVALAVRAPAHV
ncbi:glycosyltransferase family 4 protein [Sphingomonas sp. BK345]|uniref:glycosyltransferase family 4 protein n=1 Tax=Sphingomonas sp. BK345 TaxID=2586980 RepID=UPI001615E20F|nr:glycosyltransferase [Sphingomonas sp. BK345]MBB3474128.1 glycosyltransferase involved in cell wall biosynthesis [Sphingomonas sp. BK345]